MKKLLVALALVNVMPLIVGSSVSAQSNTRAQLTITPTVCVVDVTQDGTNQTVHIPSSDCRAALPILLAPSAEQVARRPQLATVPLTISSLPFAGTGPVQQQLAVRPGIEGMLTPIVRRNPDPSPSAASPQILKTMLAFGMALVASAIGIDIALFELHYSKTVARWTHRQTAGRMLNR